MNETIAKTRPKTMTKLPFSPCIWPFLGSSAFQVPSWLSFLSAVHLEVVFRPLCCFAWYTFFGSRRKKCITCPLRSREDREECSRPGGATLLMHLNFLLPSGVAAAEETADTNYFQFVICGCGCQEAVGSRGSGIGAVGDPARC